jgi:MFS family permease
MPPRSTRPLPPTVLALAAVSLLTDVSSEMIYPLIPVFLTTTLGVSAGFVGVIEGAAESVAALLKLASGWWSDRLARRKPLVVAGYSLAAFARPLVALATTGWQVLGIRLVDRVGKGIRSAPRDALLADAAPVEARGRAFGFHRAADNLGAVLGPLAAFALLRWSGTPIRTVFWLAAVPALLGVVVLVVAVRETQTGAPRPGAGARPEAGPVAIPVSTPLGARFWGVLSAIFVFTLGNSSDAFLLLRAAELGVPIAVAPLIWAALNFVKSVSNTPGGALSDRVGRRPVVVAGWVLYAAVYVGFSFATTTWHAWALFLVYGLVFGLTEGTEKALVADLVPAARRGTAFGWYNLAIGIGALPASLLFGLLWNRYGSPIAFLTGAALAFAASCVLLASVGGAGVSRSPGISGA